MSTWTQFTTPRMDTAQAYANQAANGALFGRSTFNPGFARTGAYGADDTRRVATSEPLMVYAGQGAPSKVSETGSALRVGDSHRDRARQVLNPREFIGAPFFGVGTQPQDVQSGSELLLDQTQRSVKSQGTLSDKRTNYFEMPLLPDVRKDLTNDARFAFNAMGADTRHVFVKRLN